MGEEKEYIRIEMGDKSGLGKKKFLLQVLRFFFLTIFPNQPSITWFDWPASWLLSWVGIGHSFRARFLPPWRISRWCLRFLARGPCCLAEDRTGPPFARAPWFSPREPWSWPRPRWTSCARPAALRSSPLPFWRLPQNLEVRHRQAERWWERLGTWSGWC